MRGISFINLYPDINLKIVMSYGMHDLASRVADVAIRHVDNSPDFLIGKRVGRISECAYASKRYLSEHDALDDPGGGHWLNCLVQ